MGRALLVRHDGSFEIGDARLVILHDVGIEVLEDVLLLVVADLFDAVVVHFDWGVQHFMFQ